MNLLLWQSAAAAAAAGAMQFGRVRAVPIGDVELAATFTADDVFVLESLERPASQAMRLDRNGTSEFSKRRAAIGTSHLFTCFRINHLEDRTAAVVLRLAADLNPVFGVIRGPLYS